MKIFVSKLKILSVIIFASIFLTSCDISQSIKNTISPTATSIENNESTERVEQVEVAIMLPISQYNQGESILQSIKNGLQNTLVNKNVNISTYDVHDQNSAIEAMVQVIDKKTSIIIGPLLATHTTAIAPLAKRHNITVLSLSNNPLVAQENIYVCGHDPNTQPEQLINFLVKQGNKNFILMLPNNSQQLSQNISAIISHKGGKVLLVSEYEDSQSIYNEILKVSKTISSFNELDTNLDKIVLYISGSDKRLSYVVSELKKHSVDQSAIIVGDHRMSQLDVDMIYTGSRGAAVENKQSYDLVSDQVSTSSVQHNIFGTSVIQKLGHDLGALVAQYINTNREFDKDAFIKYLNNTNGHMQSSGFLLFSDNVASRKYDIIKKAQGKITILNKEK